MDIYLRTRQSRHQMIKITEPRRLPVSLTMAFNRRLIVDDDDDLYRQIHNCAVMLLKTS